MGGGLGDTPQGVTFKNKDSESGQPELNNEVKDCLSMVVLADISDWNPGKCAWPVGNFTGMY